MASKPDSKPHWQQMLKRQQRLRIPRIRNMQKYLAAKAKYKLPFEVRLKNLFSRGGVDIWLVDDTKIRQLVDVDFTMGGHGYRYLYIPENEIWISRFYKGKSELMPVVHHELTERALMKKNMSYAVAHDMASISELAERVRQGFVLGVKPFRQTTRWTCTPAALKIALDYYGHKPGKMKNEMRIAKLAKTSARRGHGTYHKDIHAVVRKLGFAFREKENAGIADIEKYLLEGIPVIVDYQAYGGGHTAVIAGMKGNALVLADPASERGFVSIKKADFLRRWHDTDEGRRVRRWMFAVLPKK